MNSRGLVAAICVIAMSITVAAECVFLNDFADQKRAATFVFDGTVTRVDHSAPDGTLTTVDVDTLDDLARLAQPEDSHLRVYKVTMAVHRVWKGDTSKEITVYFVLTADGPFFKRGTRQVVFAYRETEQIRKSFWIDPKEPQRNAWVFPCSGLRSDAKELLKQLGASRKPSTP